MTQPIATSEVLYRAADLIEERGWLGLGADPDDDPWGGGARGNAPVCLEGGMLAAMGIALPPVNRPGMGNGEREAVINGLIACPAYVSVCAYLGRDPEQQNLWLWNDTAGRTADEVIATLRAAAVIEAAKENTEAVSR